MKKTEFLARLDQELQRRNVADAADILEEYAQHFDLKLADGYSEEEIAARIGDPAMLAAAALSFAAAAVCLLGGLNVYGLLPAVPYWCGAVLGLSLLALTVLFAVGCVYYGAFLRQMIRSFGRFQHNALAGASGEAVLPSLPIAPQFSAKARRRLRTTALIALALFAACFVLAFVVCALSAGSLQFWHVWGWFMD